VTAVDNDEAAITALKAASSTTSGLKPIEVERRDLYRRPVLAGEFRRFDAVVFDPPRQGAEAQYASWQRAACRSLSRCHGMLRPSRAMRESW